jgi:hypothetical protein
LSQGGGIARADELAETADGPSFRYSIQLGSNHRSTARVSLQNYGRKSLGRNLWVNKTVERMVKRNRIGLLADETGSVFEAEVADIVAKKIFHRSRARDQKAGMGKMSHDDLGGLKENSLAFSYWKVESADHSKDEFVWVKRKPLARLQGVSRSHRAKKGGIDSCMDDVKFFWGDMTRATVMSLWNGRGWVIMTVQEDLGHKRGDRKNGIGVGE